MLQTGPVLWNGKRAYWKQRRQRKLSIFPELSMKEFLNTERVYSHVLLPFLTAAHTEADVYKVLTRKSQQSLFTRISYEGGRTLGSLVPVHLPFLGFSH